MTALLGEITPLLRVASIKWNANLIELHFVYHGNCSEKEKERMACVATEVISDFPEHELEVIIEQIDYPLPIPDNIGEIVYWRREHS